VLNLEPSPDPFHEEKKRCRRKKDDAEIDVRGSGKFYDDWDGEKRKCPEKSINSLGSLLKVTVDKQGSQKGETEMNEFGENVVPEIERNEVEKVQIHGIVRERHERNFIHASVLEIQLWNG